MNNPTKVVIIDTSILCVWLEVPGKQSCGNKYDRWDKLRVNSFITKEIKNGSTLVLPMATIIETGNHISQSNEKRFECAVNLADIMKKTADHHTPWAAFTDQSVLWDGENLKTLAEQWPNLAATKLSIGDATIKQVAEYYAMGGYSVEILTGDSGLKAYEPIKKPPVPRRKR